jgi:uridine kinase
MDAAVAVADAALGRRERHPPEFALLVGLSGIDGSGKGYLASCVLDLLAARGMKTAKINVDGWLNLPEIRIDLSRPAQNFYDNALRLDELFARLVLPLRAQRRIEVAMDWVDETASATRPYTYRFEDTDIILLEGAYLFKKAYRPHFDLAVWVDCSWETALERSIARAQEGLPPDETVQAYSKIYFPAEELHFLHDAPRASADLIVSNDPRRSERRAAGATI